MRQNKVLFVYNKRKVYNRYMILLVGASASGKTEIAKELTKLFGIEKAVTTTTREPRVNEKHGVDYFFISKEEFIKKEKKGLFVETTNYNDNYYGCGKDQISDSKIVIVDPNGLKSFLKLGDKRIITFFMSASEETRFNRMIERGDSLEDAKARIELDRKDFSYNNIGKTNYVINTENSNAKALATEVYKKYINSLCKHHK